MSTDMWKCLEALYDLSKIDDFFISDFFISFSPIQHCTKLSRQEVRRAVRALARKGYAEFKAGLWTEDGRPAGAGYCITKTGRAAWCEGRRK